MALALTLPGPARKDTRLGGGEATHVDFVRLDLIAGRHRRGLFSINHDSANTMLHTLSNLMGNFKLWHKDQMQMRKQVITTTCRF